MDKYLKQKIPLPDPDIKEQKALDFMEKLKALKNSPAPVEDRSLSDGFKVATKTDVIKPPPIQQVKPVGNSIIDTIDKLAEHRAKRQLALGKAPVQEEVLDYSKFKKPKVLDAVEKVYDAGAVKKEYEALRKAALRGGKKLGAAIGPIGAIGGALMAGSADEALANTLIPGGLEGVGEGSDQMPVDDTAQIQMLSETATDPNIRRAAIQELRNRLR